MDKGPRDSVEDRINRFREAEPASRSDRFRVNEIRPLHYDQPNTFELSALGRSDGYQAPHRALQQTLGGGTREDFATGNFQDRYPSMDFEESGGDASLQAAGDTCGGHYSSDGQAPMMNTLHGNTSSYSVRDSTGSEKSYGVTGNFNQRYPSMQMDDDGDKELDILTTADSFELRAHDDNVPYKGNGSGSYDISASAYPRKGISTMPTPAVEKGDYGKYNTITIDNDNNVSYIKGRLIDGNKTEAQFDPTRERDSAVRPAFPILNKKQKNAKASEASTLIASQDLKSLKKDLLLGSATTSSHGQNVHAVQASNDNRSLIEALLDGGEGYQRNMKAALTYSPSADVVGGNATMSSNNTFSLDAQKNATMPTLRNIPNSFPIKTPDISPHTSVNIAGGDRRLFDSPGARPEAIIGQDPSTGRFNWTGRSVQSNDGSVDGLMMSEYAYKKSGGTYRGPKYGTDILDQRPTAEGNDAEQQEHIAATHDGRIPQDTNAPRRPSLGTSLDQWKSRLSHPPPKDGTANATDGTEKEKKDGALKSPISPERMQKLNSLPWYRSSVDSQASTQPESDSEMNIGTATIDKESMVMMKPPIVESVLPPSPDLSSLSTKKDKENEKGASGSVAASSDSLRLNLDLSPAATSTLRPPQIPAGNVHDSADMLKLRGFKGRNGNVEDDAAATDQSTDLLEIRKELLAIDKKAQTPSQSQEGVLPLKIDGKTLNTTEIDKMLMEESGWMHTQDNSTIHTELGEVNANVTSLIADMRAKDKAIQQSLLQQSYDKNMLKPGEVESSSQYHTGSIIANKNGSNDDNGNDGKGLHGYQDGDISVIAASPSVQNLFKSSHIIELEHTLDGITVKADELMKLKRDALETVKDVEKLRADEWVKKQARYYEEFDMIQEYISTQQNTQAQYEYNRNRVGGGDKADQEGSTLDDDNLQSSFVNHSLNDQGLHTLHSIEQDIREEHQINKSNWLHKDLDALYTTLGPAKDGLMTFADGNLWEGSTTRAGSVARQVDPLRVFKEYHMFPEAGDDGVVSTGGSVNPFDEYGQNGGSSQQTPSVYEKKQIAQGRNWRELEYLHFHNALGEAQKEKLLARLQEHGSVPADVEKNDWKNETDADTKSNYYSYMSTNGDKGKDGQGDKNGNVEEEVSNGNIGHVIIPVNSDKHKYPWMGLTEADQHNPFSHYSISRQASTAEEKALAIVDRLPTSVPGLSTSSRAHSARKHKDAIRESVYGTISDMISTTNSTTDKSTSNNGYVPSRILLGSRQEKLNHSRMEKEALKQQQSQEGGFKLVIGSKGEGSEYHNATRDHPRQDNNDKSEEKKEKKYTVEFEAPGIEQGPMDREIQKVQDVNRVVELRAGMGFQSSTGRTLPSGSVVEKLAAPTGGNGDVTEAMDSHWRHWSSPAQPLDLASLQKGGEGKARAPPPEDVRRVLELLQGMGLDSKPSVSSTAKPEIATSESQVVSEPIDTTWRKWTALTASLDKTKVENEGKVRSPEQQQDVGRVLEILQEIHKSNPTASTSLATAPPMEKAEAPVSGKEGVSDANWLKWSAPLAPTPDSKPKQKTVAPTAASPSISDGLRENGYLTEAVANRIIANMLGHASGNKEEADLRPEKRSQYMSMFDDIKHPKPVSAKKIEKPVAPAFSTQGNSIMPALDYRIYPSPNVKIQKAVAPTCAPHSVVGMPSRGSNALSRPADDDEVRIDLRAFAGATAGRPSASGPMYSGNGGRDPFSVLKAGTTTGAPVMEKENYLQTSRHLRQKLMGQYKL